MPCAMPAKRPSTPKPISKLIQQLKEWRVNHDMSQQEFADWLGFPVGSLRNWEQGQSSPEEVTAAFVRKFLQDNK